MKPFKITDQRSPEKSERQEERAERPPCPIQWNRDEEAFSIVLEAASAWSV
jgi:hypothetical protein